MDIQDYWEKALKKTEIVRARVSGLDTFAATSLPYILLSESSVNIGDTVVRKGEVVVEKPALILPQASPQFEGFDFKEKLNLREDMLTNFLLVRGVAFPSLKYNNKTYSVDIFEGELGKAVKSYLDKLQKEEDVHTGLIVAPEDCWQFSALIFIGIQVIKSAETDIRRMMNKLRERNN